MLRLDATSRYPFPSAAFRQFHTEHFIEHLSLPDAAAMLEECRRVLVPGGRLRVATPDLAFLLGLTEPPIPPDPERRDESRRLADRYAAWQSGRLGLPGPNGFVVECGLDESGDPALRGLAHSERLPPGFLALETLTLEAERPVEPRRAPSA